MRDLSGFEVESGSVLTLLQYQREERGGSSESKLYIHYEYLVGQAEATGINQTRGVLGRICSMGQSAGVRGAEAKKKIALWYAPLEGSC